MIRLPAWVAGATSAALLLAAGVTLFAQAAGGEVADAEEAECRAEDVACASPRTPARRGAAEADCAASSPECVAALNASVGADFVPFDEVMELAERVGREQLHTGAIKGKAWLRRFNRSYCAEWHEEAFPDSREAVAKLRKRISELERSVGGRVILAHVDSLEDGIGARVKKAVELVAAGLRLGFFGVALAVPPTGGLIHPKEVGSDGATWPYGAVWCHESPADGPEAQDTRSPEYPLTCWRFDFQADILGQSASPKGRTLLWGAPVALAALSAEKDGTATPLVQAGADEADRVWGVPREATAAVKDAPDGDLFGVFASRYACVAFKGGVEDGKVWNFHREQGALDKSSSELRRLFESARSFASPAAVLPGRREVQCGHGLASDLVHVAVHFRRGDVGDKAGYAVPQQLGAKGFSEWLCDLADTLDVAESGRKLFVHFHTEAAGRSRAALRRAAARGELPGLKLDPGASDDEAPIFHTLGRLSPPPSCGEAKVASEVHIAVNNNPREAIMCMARADVLVTSFSSLGWVSAVLNTGVVFHPDARHAPVGVPAHWDLRDQYLDWADNWFRVSDASAPRQRAAEVRAAFARSGVVP